LTSYQKHKIHKHINYSFGQNAPKSGLFQHINAVISVNYSHNWMNLWFFLSFFDRLFDGINKISNILYFHINILKKRCEKHPKKRVFENFRVKFSEKIKFHSRIRMQFLRGFQCRLQISKVQILSQVIGKNNLNSTFVNIRYNSKTIRTIHTKIWYIKLMEIMNILCLIIFFDKTNIYGDISAQRALGPGRVGSCRGLV